MSQRAPILLLSRMGVNIPTTKVLRLAMKLQKDTRLPSPILISVISVDQW